MSGLSESNMIYIRIRQTLLLPIPTSTPNPPYQSPSSPPLSISDRHLYVIAGTLVAMLATLQTGSSELQDSFLIHLAQAVSIRTQQERHQTGSNWTGHLIGRWWPQATRSVLQYMSMTPMLL